MEIRLYFQMLKRGWWIILLTALTAMVGTLVASYFIPPRYKAEARFIINPINIAPASPDIGLWGLDILGNQTVITTYMEVMKSNRVYEGSLAALGLLPENMEDYSYEVQVLPNSTVIELIVTGPNADIAAGMANSIGNQTIIFTARLNEYYRVDFLDESAPPLIPESPKPSRDSILAFSIGLVVGAVLAIVRDQLLTSLDTYRLSFLTDKVTGVFNRRHITKVLEEELIKNPEGVLSVGFIELEGLVDLEDPLPIAEYQNILKQVTAILQKELRGNDAIGRWEKHSFLVVYPNTSGSSANQIFKRIFNSLSIPINLKHLDLSIDLNPFLGGAEYSINITPEELLEKAEEALDKARKSKSNPIYIWEIKNPFWGNEE
jgi:diguanylate cyclase (GGDEF)-like protein